MANYLTTDTELTSVADAIRAKGGTSASLVYPAGFVSAIQNIPTGGSLLDRTVTFQSKHNISDASFYSYTIESVVSGGQVSAPVRPSVTGGFLNAWNTADDGSGTDITFPYTPASDITLYGKFNIYSTTLNDNTWEKISQASSESVGANYWSVGDIKYITLNGTAGTVSLSSLSVGVYILGFNHNSAVEGTGISFGTFKFSTPNTYDSNDVTLVSSTYGSSTTTTGDYAMNPGSSASNVGGWKSCKLRYSMLGSTNVSGGNATSVCATSPVSNTLMSCLPSDLRAVMKPITKYSDNTGGGSDTASYVTTTIDYLPLLSEYEVHGARTYANSAEQNYQQQYSYYANGNSKVKYKYNSVDTSCGWWVRSVFAAGSLSFCSVSSSGSANRGSAYYSSGVVPAFLI